MALPPRKKYDGRTRRLLLAFDIGTTFSGISYSILDPGNVPEIRPVTRFPSQERAGGDSKIPTVIFYDEVGKPCKIGAETLEEGIEEDAKDNGWSQARWFKLHLRPKNEAAKPTNKKRHKRWVKTEDGDPLPPLPPNKTLSDVFTDYMKYLLHCAKEYIVDVHGPIVWTSLENNILYVLTHPNGWGGAQQAEMRKFAIAAGFVPDTVEGRERVNFVTEGEASLHFCLLNGLVIENGDEGSGVTIVDAGGGTIDVTTYRRLASASFEEVAIPQCYFQGASYVSARAEEHFKTLLAGTRFVQDIDVISRHFDRRTKHVFRKAEEPHHIQFGSSRDRDPALNIRAGRLTLEGSVVAKFFEPAIDCIVEAVKTQKNTSLYPITTVFLVGGFSASTWLFENVRKRVAEMGISVCRPDSHVNKAVSNGAVSFHLDHVVTSRVSRASYGVKVASHYNPWDPSHKKRSGSVYEDPDTGFAMIPGGFEVILPKGTRVSETTEFRQTFYNAGNTLSDLEEVSSKLMAYTGTVSGLKWVDEDPAFFRVACSVQGPIPPRAIKLEYNDEASRSYLKANFDVVVRFGLTEMKAQIAWEENGEEKRGPAEIAYE